MLADANGSLREEGGRDADTPRILDLSRGNSSGTREGQGNACVALVCKLLLLLLRDVAILGLDLARQARADSTQLGVKGDGSAGNIVRLRSAQAASSAGGGASFGRSSVVSGMSSLELGGPFLPFAFRDHETVVDGFEEGSLELAEILDGQARDLGPGAVRIGAILNKLGSDHDGGEEHASRASNQAKLFLGHADQRRGGRGFDLNLDASSTSRLSESVLLGLLGSIAKANAVEESCLQSRARSATTAECLANKDLERQSALALGKVTLVRRS